MNYKYSMKKLAIFGATGLTGKELVKEAASRGYSLRILARREIPITELPDGVELIKGDYFNAASRRETLKGVDAVLSTIGPPPTRKTDLKAEDFGLVMEELIGEMKQEKVSRIINLASTGTRFSKEPFLLTRWFFRTLFNLFVPIVISGKEKELGVLSQSDLNWTTIRPPMIKTGIGGTLVTDDKIPPGHRVDTTLLVRFMLDQLDSDTWVQRAPFVAS